VTEAGPVGYTSYVYVRPELRGTGLAKTLRDQRDDLLRKHGMTIRESSRYSGNGRIAEVWQGSDWGCSWRRPIREHESGREGGSDADDGFAIRRVKDLDAEWPAIWRLLGHAGETDEVAARNRVAGTIEQRGAAYVSGSGEPSGVIVGRVSVNPWLFQERVGVVHNLAVAPDAGEATAAALLERLERWMAAKRATDMQVEPIPHEKGQSWRERGFLPYIHTRRLVL